MLKASINRLGQLGKNSLIPRALAFCLPAVKLKNINFRFIAILGLILFFTSGCALHRDVLTLDDRIGELKLRVVTLENQTSQLKEKTEKIKHIESEKENKIRGQTAEQYADIERHNEEIQMLNGRVEVLEHLLNQKLSEVEEAGKIAQERLTSVEQAMEANKNKLARIEQYLSLEGKEKPATSAVTSATPGSGNTQVSENEMYTSALKLYDGGKYAAARDKLQELLSLYPNSDIADNCQFWIGESYYREKWYEKAIIEYQKVIEKYPKGNKIRASLLKQGLSFYNLGDKKNSRLILNELIEKFPNSVEAKSAANQLKKF